MITKKTITTFLFFLALLIQFDVNAQDLALDDLYAGGSSTYNEVMRRTLKYPRTQFGSDEFGIVIYEISVDTTGKVTAKMLTYVNDDYGQSVVDAIQKTASGWIAQDEAYSVYQPVLFNRTLPEGGTLYPEISTYLESFEMPLLDIIQMYVVGIARESIRISSVSSTSSNGEVRNSSSISQGPSSSKMTQLKSLEDEIKNYQKLEKQLEKAVQKENDKKAFKALNEMILINPFDKDLIYQRMSIAMKLGDDTYRAYDIPWLKALTIMEMAK